MHSGTHRNRQPACAVALALLFSLGSVTPANAESPGVRMRRARQALSVADDASARRELEAVQATAPHTPRGLEAAMLLADLDFREGHRADAAARLTAAADAADGGFGTAIIGIARGWLAISMGEGTTARDRFREVARGHDLPLAGQVATFGQAWADLLQGRPGLPDPSLVELIEDAPHPGFRFAAGLTVARMHEARGEWSRARRRMRETRRALRGTSYEDDAELSLGLLQLDTGSPRIARATFRRLERRFGTGHGMSPSPVLTLRDLRQPPAEFAARLADLFAARERATTPLFHFLGDAFDRNAADDAGVAIALADAAIRARRGQGDA